MRIEFMGFRAEVPDDWEDRSTITFQIPPPVLEVLAVQQGSGSPGNVVIDWAPADEEADALELIEEQRAMLAPLFEGFRVHGRGESHGFGFLHFGFVANGQAIEQIVLVKGLGDRIVRVTGTAVASRFAHYRDRFVAIAESVTR